MEETNQALPETEIIKLQSIANNIEDNLGKLDLIAENNPQLDAVYQEIRILLQDGYKKRNKGGFPKIDEFYGTNIKITLLVVIIGGLIGHLLWKIYLFISGFWRKKNIKNFKNKY